MTTSGTKTIMAAASSGGHWMQLRMLCDAWSGHDVVYVTTDSRLAPEVAEGRFHTVRDSSRQNPLRLIRSAFQMLRLVRSVRPDVVITTGAAPGVAAIVFGKLWRARTVWIDSIANADKLSLSGRLVRPFADVRLTQWEHLAHERGPRYEGSVL